MPLVIKLKPGPYPLDDFWLTKNVFQEMDKREVVELFKEDLTYLLEDDLGGLENIIESVEWVEE